MQEIYFILQYYWITKQKLYPRRSIITNKSHSKMFTLLKNPGYRAICKFISLKIKQRSTIWVLAFRCVLNWFGDWSDHALLCVGSELTKTMDIESATYRAPEYFPYVCDITPRPPTYRQAVADSFVHVHKTLRVANVRLAKRGHRTTTITPRHFLDFISHYVNFSLVYMCTLPYGHVFLFILT